MTRPSIYLVHSARLVITEIWNLDGDVGCTHYMVKPYKVGVPGTANVLDAYNVWCWHGLSISVEGNGWWHKSGPRLADLSQVRCWKRLRNLTLEKEFDTKR